MWLSTLAFRAQTLVIFATFNMQSFSFFGTDRVCKTIEWFSSEADLRINQKFEAIARD